MKIQKCKSCNADIVFLKSKHTGKFVPVDATFDIFADTSDGFFDKSIHTSHFATCPNADKHRKPSELSDKLIKSIFEKYSNDNISNEIVYNADNSVKHTTRVVKWMDINGFKKAINHLTNGDKNG